MFVMQLVNFVTVFQVKVIDRSSIVTTDSETKVSQPSSLQELIDKETGKHQLNRMHCNSSISHSLKFKLFRVIVFDIKIVMSLQPTIPTGDALCGHLVQKMWYGCMPRHLRRWKLIVLQDLWHNMWNIFLDNHLHSSLRF